jgi:hypothetical protein
LLADLTRAAGVAQRSAVGLIGQQVDAGSILTGATSERRTRGSRGLGLARALLADLLAVLPVAVTLLALLALAAPWFAFAGLAPGRGIRSLDHAEAKAGQEGKRCAPGR